MEHSFFNQLFPANTDVTTPPIINNRSTSDPNDTTIATTTYPLGLLVHNGFLYVTHFNIGGSSGTNNNTITKINLSDNSETTWITSDNGLSAPTSLLIHDGFIYVANMMNAQNSGFISKISLDNNNPTIDNQWFTLPNKPIFDILEHGGYFYVTGLEFGRINIATKSYELLVSTSSPYYMSLDGNYIYVASNSPFKYNLTTGTHENFTTNTQTTKFFMYNNTLYGLNMASGGITQMNLLTNVHTTWKTTGTLPVNITITNNYFYVANHQGPTISRLVPPGGGGGGSDGPSGPSNPGSSGGGIPGGSMGGGGTTDHFFINDPFTISQTATMFSQSLAVPYTNQYDYILDININSVWASMNNLFTERRFMTEFTHNDSNYDFVHLNVDRTSLASLLTTANVVSISSDNESIFLDHAGVYGTLDNQNGQLAGFRFLEIVATKIFGHAKTKIAIENSNEYYINDYVNANTAVNSLIGQIAKGIFNSVITKKIDIMNDYIATDRLEDNTHNAPLININGYPHPFMEFNFNDTVWEFPILFHTELTSTSNSSIGELNNGPNVGGARLVNGTVDVPVLLRFSA